MGKGSGNVNSQPLVSCLMATYGRHAMVERALACFLRQDYDNCELIILNSHATPLATWEKPQIVSTVGSNQNRIRIYNEPCWSTLGDQRNRLLSLAQGEFIRTWDDDDIYLPSSISQGVQGLLSNPSHGAWKPRRSFYSPDNGATFTLAENIHEPSITFRADIARKYGYFSNSSGDEHISLIDGVNHHEGGFAQGDVNDAGDGATFVYIWGNGVEHISGSLNQKVSAIERAAKWREKQRDARLTPLKPDWKATEEWFKKIEKWKQEHKA